MKAFIRCALVIALMSAGTQASPVTNWVLDAGPGIGSNLNTASPTIGDGTVESADAVTFHSDFPAITLANSGDAIILSGAVTLSGITATDAGTNQQLRFGLFDRLGSPNTNGWLGYFGANSTGANAGVIRQRTAGNTDLFISNTGSTIVASTANPPNSKTGATITNDTYNFLLQITRDGTNYDISGSLSGGPGGNFNDSFSINDLAPVATETYTFNNVGFLLGTAMNVDQAQYSNVDVTYVPEPASLACLGLGSLLLLGRRRRR